MTSQLELVWVQNLISLIEGKFPRDDPRWNKIFIANLRAITPANPVQVVSEEQRLAAIYAYASVAGDCNVDALVAALTAAIGAGGQAVAVKPLEWSEVREPNEDIRYTHVIADSALGRWSIQWKSWKDIDDRTIFLNDDFVTNGGDDLDEAKAAARADYERRILSALANPTKGTG